MNRILVLGRFQPPHRGHLQVIEDASRAADQVIVVVGSAQASYTTLNPFTAGERIEMLLAAFQHRGITNALPIPILDLNRHAEWVAHVESLVPAFHEVVTNNALTHALFEAAGYRVRKAALLRRNLFSGTHIRLRLHEGKPVDPLVDPPVAAILKKLRASQRLRQVAEDHH